MDFWGLTRIGNNWRVRAVFAVLEAFLGQLSLQNSGRLDKSGAREVKNYALGAVFSVKNIIFQKSALWVEYQKSALWTEYQKRPLCQPLQAVECPQVSLKMQEKTRNNNPSPPCFYYNVLKWVNLWICHVITS